MSPLTGNNFTLFQLAFKYSINFLKIRMPPLIRHPKNGASAPNVKIPNFLALEANFKISATKTTHLCFMLQRLRGPCLAQGTLSSSSGPYLAPSPVCRFAHFLEACP